VQDKRGDDSLVKLLNSGTELLDNAPSGVVIINPQGIVLYFNHAAEALFQRDASAVVGENVSALIPEPLRNTTTTIFVITSPTAGRRSLAFVVR